MTHAFTRIGRALSLALTLLAVVPERARSQAITISVAPAIPQAEFGERRSLGGQIALAVSPVHLWSGFSVRGEIAQSWFPTRSSRNRLLAGRSEGTVSVTGALAYLIYSDVPRRASLYGGFGLGGYVLQIEGDRDSYGLVPGIGLVGGLRIGEGRVRGIIELQQQVVLSDYGNSEMIPSTFMPVRLGVSVQLP